MTFAHWQSLAPEAAARELHARLEARLAPAQRRAAIAQVGSVDDLARAFAAAPRAAPLSGVPYFLKDLFPLSGVAMRAGSTFLPEVKPPATRDATLVSRLRAAGAVVAGLTHLNEFAYGITGENPHYGDCEHPRFPGRLTGGSSSGSAAVVAAGIVPLAIGSDTGGSVRVPAAFCGLYGMRLTPGSPEIADAFPLAPSFDTAGWFTADAGDMARSLRTLIGSAEAGRRTRGLYVELAGLDAEVAVACRDAAQRLSDAPDGETASALTAAFADGATTYNTVVADEAWEVHRAWAERYRERYDPGVWGRLTRVRGVTDEQRATARAARKRIQETWTAFFAGHDFLMLAASPFPAPTKAECTLENRGRILHLTAPASVAGLPVLTLPVPLPSGLTTGLQIITRSATSPVLEWALNTWSESF